MNGILSETTELNLCGLPQGSVILHLHAADSFYYTILNYADGTHIYISTIS